MTVATRGSMTLAIAGGVRLALPWACFAALAAASVCAVLERVPPLVGARLCHHRMGDLHGAGRAALRARPEQPADRAGDLGPVDRIRC